MDNWTAVFGLERFSWPATNMPVRISFVGRAQKRTNKIKHAVVQKHLFLAKTFCKLTYAVGNRLLKIDFSLLSGHHLRRLKRFDSNHLSQYSISRSQGAGASIGQIVASHIENFNLKSPKWQTVS